MYWQTWFGLQGEPKTDVMLLRLLFRLCVKVKERYSVKLEYFCFHPPAVLGCLCWVFLPFLSSGFSQATEHKGSVFFSIPGCFTFIQSKDATFNSLYLSLQKTTALYELPMLEVSLQHSHQLCVRGWMLMYIHVKLKLRLTSAAHQEVHFFYPNIFFCPLKCIKNMHKVHVNVWRCKF